MSAFSQPAADIHFDLLTVKDGLPYNIIHDITRDSKGFLWIATPEGLCRYDGTSFISFRHNPRDSASLMNNHVNSLAADGKGNLWGSTRDGLFRFDPSAGIFKNYYPQQGDSFTVSCDNMGRVFIDHTGKLYVGSWTDYNVYDPVRKTFSQYRHLDSDSSTIREEKVAYTYEDRNGRIWIGTFSGLDLLDPGTNSFTHIKLPSLFSQFGNGPLINDIYDDGKGNLWMTTWGSGLIRYGIETGESKIFQIEKDRRTNGSTNVAVKILHTNYPGEQNKLWIATKSSGLYLFDMQSETFTRFAETDNASAGFVTSDINTLYDDGAGNIFVGTHNGILHYSRSKQFFSTIRLGIDSMKCLTNVFSVYEDPMDKTGNTLYVGTWTCGGFRYNRSSGVLEWLEEISKTDEPMKEFSTVNNFYRDHHGNMWVFCPEGTFIQQRNAVHWNKVPADDADPHKPWKKSVSAFKEAEDGTFWLGCRNGLMHFDPVTGNTERVRFDADGNNKLVFPATLNFCEYPSGIFWIVGATGALIRYDSFQKQTTVYRYDRKDPSSFPVIYDLREIMVDHRGKIWMGSNSGLITFDPMDKIPAYKIYHTSDGLASEAVFSICEDAQGKIWCATQNGLSSLDAVTGNFRNYGVNDGLNDLYLSGAFSLSARGNLFLGEQNCIQYFDPLKIGKNNYCGPLCLTGIKVLGKEYSGSRTPAYLDTIRLSYRENEVTISFAMLNYSEGSQSSYEYYLEGLNESWIPSGRNHFVTFTNLGGGTYQLHVRGYNADGVCGDGEKMLTLIVTPPFWKTNTFYVLCVLAVCLGIFGYNRFRLQNLRKQKKELEATVAQRTEQLRVEKERAEQSEKFKQQFLANMSHEIRTPMNAVMGMTNLLIAKKPRSDQEKYLKGIQQSSDILLHIINDILDLAKVEAGKIELEQIDFSVYDVVDLVRQTLVYKAEEKGLQLLTDVSPDVPPAVVGDPVRLNQVLINLAGNAIKFTDKGAVSVKVENISAMNGMLVLRFTISDTGIGIPREKLESVFENFTQAHITDTRKYGGTGLGLSISRQLVDLMGGRIKVESVEGSGSTFSFELSYAEGSAEKLRERKLDGELDGRILNGLKILIADDNEYNRTVAKDTLAVNGDLEITEAENGAQAVQLLSEKKMDVVLMDVQMPVMDGYAATLFIRNPDSPVLNHAIPVIALTASVVRSDLDKCRQAGMNDYVPKPFKASQLIAAIARAAGRELRFTQSDQGQNHTTVREHLEYADLSYLRKFCEGDQARMAKYIGMFLETEPLLIEKINASLLMEDFNDIAAQVHGFKTKLVMMGMNAARDLAASVEQNIRDGNITPGLKDEVSRLAELIRKGAEELSPYRVI